jgi:twitching motility protein PilT
MYFVSKIKEKINVLVTENFNFSDVLIKSGDPFRFRIPSGLQILGDDFIDSNEITMFLEHTHGKMDYDKQLEENGGHIDFSLDFAGLRWRCNMFWYGGKRQYGLALRKLNAIIPEFESLGAPALVKQFSNRSNGLILVTGATGSGKSTTLASLIAMVNRNSNAHIITLEDPIEYVHDNIQSSVTQREIGADVSSFSTGLTAALREDPDVILIGEIRDRATAEAALTAAETGHLVFSTLHTTSAAKTIERMTDFFSGDEKELMRNVLASVLAGICSQILIPDIKREKRVLVCEVMQNNAAISSIIRKNQMQQVPNEIAQGAKEGMTLLNKELAKLVAANVISRETAFYSAYDQAALQTEMSGGGTR